MKKRLKRKIEKRRRAEVHRVLDLVLDINGLGRRQENLLEIFLQHFSIFPVTLLSYMSGFARMDGGRNHALIIHQTPRLIRSTCFRRSMIWR